jgi:hypothetical protein
VGAGAVLWLIADEVAATELLELLTELELELATTEDVVDGFQVEVGVGVRVGVGVGVG